MTHEDLQQIRILFREEFNSAFKPAFDQAFKEAFKPAFDDAFKEASKDFVTKKEFKTEIQKLRNSISNLIVYFDERVVPLENFKIKASKILGIN